MTDETIIGGEPKLDADGKPAEEPKLDADGKPVEESKLDADGKPVEESKLDADGKPVEKKEEAGAPEAYADFNMSEGFEVDKVMMETFLPMAKEFNLSQENAQKVIDLHVKGLKDATDAHVKSWADAMGKWKDEAKADKEIGGEQFGQTQLNVTLALKTFGTEKLGEILEVTGVGNHVELVRFFDKVGALVANDKIDLGNVVADGPKSRAEIMYPNQGGTA